MSWMFEMATTHASGRKPLSKTYGHVIGSCYQALSLAGSSHRVS